MGEFAKTVGRKSRKTATGSETMVTLSVPPWADGAIMTKANAAMRKALKGVPLGQAPSAVAEQVVQGMMEVYLAGYDDCLHPGPCAPGLEEGSQHIVANALKGTENRKLCATMFRRAAQLLEEKDG